MIFERSREQEMQNIFSGYMNLRVLNLHEFFFLYTIIVIQDRKTYLVRQSNMIQ